MSIAPLSQALPLLELLRHAGGMRPEELCKMALGEASAAVRSFLGRGAPPSAANAGPSPLQHLVLLVQQHLDTLRALLASVGDADELSRLAEEAVASVCVPCVTGLASVDPQPETSVVAASVAGLLGDLMWDERMVKLGGEVVGDVFVPLVRSLASDSSLSLPGARETEVGSTPLDPRFIFSLLRAVLSRCKMEDRVRSPAYGEALSALFAELVAALQRCELSACVLLASSVLPLFVTERHLDRVGVIWNFVECVFSGETRTEADGFMLVSTLLCCFCDVFIRHDSSSPFSVAFDAKVIGRTGPVVDLRQKQVFWAILQRGLSSSDPLSRKRCKYLLHRVLVSVRQDHDEDCGSGDVACDNFVFWWSEPNREQLENVWGDLMLLLETIEEKQVWLEDRVVRWDVSVCMHGRTFPSLVFAGGNVNIYIMPFTYR